MKCFDSVYAQKTCRYARQLVGNFSHALEHATPLGRATNWHSVDLPFEPMNSLAVLGQMCRWLAPALWGR